MENLLGQTFNYLTIIDGPQRKNGRVYWICKCSCGNIKTIRADGLKSGKVKSCGCYKKSVLVKKNKERQTLDLSNKRFGKLVALEPTENRSKDGRVMWLCKCDCGNQIEVDTHSLVQHKVSSCGCLCSLGELEIEQILREHNIPFQRQQTFNSCRYKDTGYLARFDFFVNETYLIEYDGEQHFYYKDSQNTWNNRENSIKVQQHDIYKNEWCEQNNIPLIRIPYTLKGRITLDDLLLSSSNYRIVPR